MWRGCDNRVPSAQDESPEKGVAYGSTTCVEKRTAELFEQATVVWGEAACVSYGACATPTAGSCRSALGALTRPKPEIHRVDP